jgi:hypothetical protein
MYVTLNMKHMARMTPIAQKLYQPIAGRPATASFELAKFQQLCGIELKSEEWLHHVAEACHEFFGIDGLERFWIEGGEIKWAVPIH